MMNVNSGDNSGMLIVILVIVLAAAAMGMGGLAGEDREGSGGQPLRKGGWWSRRGEEPGWGGPRNM